MSFRPHALALSVVVAGLTLAGCGEEDILSPQQIALTCNNTAKSICDRIKRCGVEYRFARDYGNEQGCIALEKGRCERQLARPKTM